MVMVFVYSSYPYRTFLLNTIEITQEYSYCLCFQNIFLNGGLLQHQMENFDISNTCHVICTICFDNYRENISTQSIRDRGNELQPQGLQYF